VTVEELRVLLAGHPGDCLILIPGPDGDGYETPSGLELVRVRRGTAGHSPECRSSYRDATKEGAAEPAIVIT
jgi:hypothetical protein